MSLFSPKGQRDDFRPQHPPSWSTSFVAPCLLAPATFHPVFSGSLCTCFSFLGWTLTSEDRGHGCFVSPCLALAWAWRDSRCGSAEGLLLRARHRVLSLLANEPVTVLSAYVLLTGTLLLLTLLPHHSTPLYPQTFVPTVIFVSAWPWKAVSGEGTGVPSQVKGGSSTMALVRAICSACLGSLLHHLPCSTETLGTSPLRAHLGGSLFVLEDSSNSFRCLA